MSNKRNKNFKILQPGISISSKYSTNGTLGLIVFDKTNNYQPCILSNWHVLAKRSFIPRISFRRGSPIFQPGKLPQNGRLNQNTIVARLTRYDKITDSAIAKITNRDFIPNQFETSALIKAARVPVEGDIVEKSGARTGVTRGKVVDIRGSIVTIKPMEDINPLNIEISAGGDSGCVWYDPVTFEGLVLHNSGEVNKRPEEEFAKGTMLVTVLKVLNISLTDNNTKLIK